jgi:hypothetical protein
MDGWKDGWRDGWMTGRMDEWTNTYVCNIYIERVCVKERKQKYG